MTEVEQPPPQNGIDLSGNEDDDNNKSRPADIEQDMREMERRKRVEAIMGSKLFREELERIVDSARDGGTSGILQQLSDIVGLPTSRVGSVYKASNCLMPINDIRGVESMGYAKGEKILRCKLAATFRLLDLYGWTQGLGAQITARLKVDQEYFLVNPYGLLYHEITASSLNKVDMQGNVVEQGTTNFGVNKSHFVLHSVVHAARPDIRCAIYIGCSPVVAISSLKAGLLPITRDACVLGEVTTHSYSGALDNEERDRLIRNLGPNSKVMLLTNHGALCCGETIEEAFHAACHIVQACETQLKLLPVGLENLTLIAEESRKIIYEQSRRPPEDLEKKFAAVSTAEGAAGTGTGAGSADDADAVPKIGAAPKWRVGGAEFEALMRMLDNAGYRTGYIYRHPLIKSEPPKPKNDVELPPAVSSLGYLLEEEELFRQGIWKKGELRKGGDRSRWLNSPNVYQKVEVLETGTPDPKKITKWVAEGSPTHSTPVRIEDPLQFVPAGTNPKEFKRLQQQIKDNRRAEKISAGPQSHILEGVTWDEANRIRDATVSSTGDHVVLVGAASKGIIQRGFQHNATVYKAPYAKNPFDNVTDDELNEYKRTVERKKKSIHGEYTDTDFSESEALSSLPPAAQGKHGKTAGATQSEPEDMGAHQVMRIETQQAPVPSQPEVVLSDAMKKLQAEIPVEENVSLNIPQRELQDQEAHFLMNNPEEAHLQGEALRVTEKTNLNQEKSNEIFNNKTNNNNNKNNNNIVEIFSQHQESPLLFVATNENQSKLNNFENDMSFVSKNKENIEPNDSNDLTFNDTLPVPNTSVSDFRVKDNENHNDSLKKQRPIVCIYNDYEYPIIERDAFGSINSNNYETIYETISSASTQSVIVEALYKPSAACETPMVCSKVFESLLLLVSAETVQKKIEEKPNKMQQEYLRRKRRHNAYTYHTKIDTYRTISHFGFNSPKRTLRPDHKHLPSNGINGEKIYIPLRRTLSYEEIFSSQRYKDLCEPCFDKIVRIKPNWLIMNGRKVKSLDDGGSYVDLEERNNSNIDFFNSSEDSSTTLPDYDYVMPEFGQSTTHSRRLEPLIEVDEHDNESKIVRSNASFNSTFFNKIMRMNFSDESSIDHYNIKSTQSQTSHLVSIIENDEEKSDPTIMPDINDTIYHSVNEETETSANEECVSNNEYATAIFDFPWNYHPIARENHFITETICDDLREISENYETINNENNLNASKNDIEMVSHAGIRDSHSQINEVNANMQAISVSTKQEVIDSLTYNDLFPTQNVEGSINSCCFPAKTESIRFDSQNQSAASQIESHNSVISQNPSRTLETKQTNLNDFKDDEPHQSEHESQFSGLVFSTTKKPLNASIELMRFPCQYIFSESDNIPQKNTLQHYQCDNNDKHNYDDDDNDNGKEIFHQPNSFFPFESYELMRQAIKENINNYEKKHFQHQEYSPEVLINLKTAWDLESNFHSFNGERNKMNGKNRIECHEVLESSLHQDEIVLSDEQLDQIEREVLTKIKQHNLKDTEGGEIFSRIEEAIRNKVTSKQIEYCLQKKHENITIFDVETLERKLIKASYVDGFLPSQNHRPNNNGIHTGDKNCEPRFNRACTTFTRYNKKQNININQGVQNSIESTRHAPGEKQQTKSSTPRHRNFIHENIRNASKQRISPRSSPRTTAKTLSIQSNDMSAKNRTLIFPHSTPKKGCSPQQQKEAIVQSYPFQAISRQNSTRLLINIPTENGGDDVAAASTSYFLNKCKKSKKPPFSSKNCGATIECNHMTSTNQKRTNLDIEIEALGSQIRTMAPQVDGFQLKCDEYGQNVAKCSRTLDECIAMQSNCIEENFQLNQFFESNSISETDD